MDIRPDDDFDDGHIAGAVNVAMADVITAAGQAGGKPIVVVCKTGQEAGHAVMGLRLSGYPDAKVLKWGMSAWNGDFDLWTPATGDIAVGHANWADGPAPAPSVYEYPAMTSNSSDGAEILAERVEAMLEAGFKGVPSSDVLGTPGDYYINNYWAAADVTTYGIIDGAYRIKPLSLEDDEFKHYDPDETVVTYCWSGQESSMVTAYLTVLGYDAKSLKYGVNSLIYSQLTSSKWGGSADYDYVTTVPALASH
jgi:rhodanese-related sulfurtransferase